ncbi:unnamed protein product [Brassica oleracea]
MYTADLYPRQGDYASDMHASIIRMFFLHGIFWVCFFFFLTLISFSWTAFGNSSLVNVDLLPWGLEGLFFFFFGKSLEGLLEYIKQNYGNPPIYILENALQENSGRPTNHQSSLNDVGRIEYLHSYIAAVLNPVRKTRGYFQWSFMDLFELMEPNYTYGLYYVNFSDPERKRSPKTSALWYSCFLNGTTNCSQDLGIFFSWSFFLLSGTELTV